MEADGFYDLSSFGWDDCKIPINLVDICRYLPNWRHLKVIRAPQIISGARVYFPFKFFESNGVAYMPAFMKGDTVDDGGYADIYRGKRAIFRPVSDALTGSVRLEKQGSFSEICIKHIPLKITAEEDATRAEVRERIYEDEINAILYEAFLHAILLKTLESVGFASAVPHIYEVIASTKTIPPTATTDFESIWISMEFINGQTLEKYLTARLRPEAKEANEEILLDVLIQLAFYLQILQDKVRFNHRDLKVNNVFTRIHPPEERWSRTLHVPGIGTWSCTHDIVIIDFGFSCVACGSGFPNPRATLVGAGNWFRAEDDCLKYGRDLCQFLYSIHSMFPLQDYVRDTFFDVIHNAMVAHKGGRAFDLMMGIDESGTPRAGTRLPASVEFTDGVYIFLRQEDVDVPGCSPREFLTRLGALVRGRGT
jgi:hypothetical protein